MDCVLEKRVDFAFELSVASRFLSAGHPVESGTLADVVAIVGRHKIYVECKRIQSDRKFITRVGEAAKQASKNYFAEKECERGLA